MLITPHNERPQPYGWGFSFGGIAARGKEKPRTMAGSFLLGGKKKYIRNEFKSQYLTKQMLCEIIFIYKGEIKMVANYRQVQARLKGTGHRYLKFAGVAEIEIKKGFHVSGMHALVIGDRRNYPYNVEYWAYALERADEAIARAEPCPDDCDCKFW